jgi:methylmalonyl-CoA/ethylmalonyl-CoA epimerase
MLVANSSELMQVLVPHSQKVDHIAFAVSNLETAVSWYQNVLGCELLEHRETAGTGTSMISAVMRNDHGFDFVLLQGRSPESQVSRFLEHYGAGRIHHVAIEVTDLRLLVDKLKEHRVEFDTTLIESPGLLQIFLKRDPESGVMIELIERSEGSAGFTDQGVNDLFLQLERNDSF